MFRNLSSSAYTRRLVVLGTSTAAITTSYYLLQSNSTLHLDSDNHDLNSVTKKRPGPLWSPPTRSQMLSHLKSSGIYIKRTPHGGPEPLPMFGNDLTVQKTPEGDDDVFDLLIVGGGATGAGAAVDAASRGLKVACVERDDFSSGTSSKSTKLVHGGVRYLQKAIMELDYGMFLFCIARDDARLRIAAAESKLTVLIAQWKMVKEALRERKIFLETAPHLSSMLP